MNVLKCASVLFFATLHLTVFADCTQKCEEVYEECKAAHDSPNGEKICGSDYYECKTLCATNGE
jgi:hypothetical protein